MSNIVFTKSYTNAFPCQYKWANHLHVNVWGRLLCRKCVFVCMYEHWYGHLLLSWVQIFNRWTSVVGGSEAVMEAVAGTFSVWGKLRCQSGLVQTAWPDNGDMEHYSYLLDSVRWHHHIKAATTASAMAKRMSLSWTLAIMWRKTKSLLVHVFIVVLIVCVKAELMSCTDNGIRKF